ncbi:uncharacterized protein LOC113472377 [Diaphorina citri]|uniref:Uncharacterized protein LOC113472377 n=1 Tax=Diaphorina citri TaxID=121845 RepID=A0A3Q0JLB0_DIACI|nr:uncharacterized protein LOC113472377 [Diaphorina citri]
MLEGDINPDEISPSGIETGTECPDSVETTEYDAVPENCRSEGSVTLLETPELKTGETPLDLNCDSDSSVSVNVPDALVDEPADNGSLLCTTDFFGYLTYLYFIFLRFCLLFTIVFPGGRRRYRKKKSKRFNWFKCKSFIIMFEILRFPQKLINVNVKRGKILRFDGKVGSVYAYMICVQTNILSSYFPVLN